jgi:archaellum component FlaC|tara:strand:- start:48 stop:599 length:552 start_codon:yes stop_codon:yes gene_type:complete
MNLKYLGYAGIILPILGATYGGLMIASDLEIKLNGAYDMAQDAHNRIDQIDSQVDGVEKYAEMLDDEADRELESSLDKIDSTIYMMNEQWTFKEKEFNRQIAEMAGRLALIDGVMSSLEKKSYDAVSLTQMDGLREQIFSLRDKIEEANRITGPDPIQEIYQLRQELEDLRRQMNDHHSGNWN